MRAELALDCTTVPLSSSTPLKGAQARFCVWLYCLLDPNISLVKETLYALQKVQFNSFEINMPSDNNSDNSSMLLNSFMSEVGETTGFF